MRAEQLSIGTVVGEVQDPNRQQSSARSAVQESPGPGSTLIQKQANMVRVYHSVQQKMFCKKLTQGKCFRSVHS